MSTAAPQPVYSQPRRIDMSGLPTPAAVQQLHHYAYKARDAEETRHFYEDILGLPLYHIIQSDYVPSTGEYCP
ncbi:MAG: VOC family protein, partial [Comamonas sp.]